MYGDCEVTGIAGLIFMAGMLGISRRCGPCNADFTSVVSTTTLTGWSLDVFSMHYILIATSLLSSFLELPVAIISGDHAYQLTSIRHI